MKPRRGRAPLERDLENWLLKWLHDFGRAQPGRLVAYHTLRSAGSRAGFPDWTFAGPRGVMFRELKRPGGKLSAEQRTWFAMLRSAGADVDVWTEADRYSGRIGTELAHLAGLHSIVDLTGKFSPGAERLIDQIMEDE